MHFALGSGDYTVTAVDVTPSLGQTATDTDFTGGSFTAEPSEALLVPVFYDERYFDEIQGPKTSPEEYLVQAFTRPGAVFTPSTADPDGPGVSQYFPGGFDEMTGVRHVFRAFPGFPTGTFPSGSAWVDHAIAHAETVLGLSSDWGGAGTQPNRHGFDYAIALTPDLGRGIARPGASIQVSSLINRDVDRQQLIAVHESGHLFGAPDCNDLGNGNGGDLLGFVMCSGEVNASYPGHFVWHSESRAKMSSIWD
jgi:hypothetical protein